MSLRAAKRQGRNSGPSQAGAPTHRGAALRSHPRTDPSEAHARQRRSFRESAAGARAAEFSHPLPEISGHTNYGSRAHPSAHARDRPARSLLGPVVPGRSPRSAPPGFGEDSEYQHAARPEGRSSRASRRRRGCAGAVLLFVGA